MGVARKAAPRGWRLKLAARSPWRRALRRVHRTTHRLPVVLRDIRPGRVFALAETPEDLAVGIGGTLLRHRAARSQVHSIVGPGHTDAPAAIARALRQAQPDVIFCPTPSDRPDAPTLADKLGHVLSNERFRGEIWMYEIWSPLWPSACVDISGVVDEKKAAISHQLDSERAEQVIGLNRYRALRVYVEYAEAFYITSPRQFTRSFLKTISTTP